MATPAGEKGLWLVVVASDNAQVFAIVDMSWGIHLNVDFILLGS